MKKPWSEMNNIAEEKAKSSPRASMPLLDHLSREDFEHVYEPSDDTFLFLDALSYEFRNNPQVFGHSNSVSTPLRTLEIGCGTDINPQAIDVTKRTAKANGIYCIENAVVEPPCMKDVASKCVVQTWHCDLATALLNDLPRKVDYIFFNPPYVCTPNEEVGGCGIEASWAGGENGRVVLDRALPQIAKLLAFPHGVAYVITIDENRPLEIAQLMLEKYGIVMEPLLRRKCKNEYLTVQKMTHNLTK